jgi:hypothetical protein
MADVFAETDPTALRALLVSTAATVARWVEDIDLRAQPPTE